MAKFSYRVNSRRDGNRLIDLTGKIYGHLLVKRVDRTKSSRFTKQHMANAYWICRCDLCECNVSIRSYYLRHGITIMCGTCASETKIRFFIKMREIEDSNQEQTKMKKKLKVTKVPAGTLPTVLMFKTYGGQNAYNQIMTLRDCGTSVKDIADLLNLTWEDVRIQIAKHRAQRKL